MLWPVDVKLPEKGEKTRYRIQHKWLEVARIAAGHLDVTYDDRLHHRIGIDESATTLRFIPHPGQLPLLNFLDPHQLCPGRSTTDIVITVNLHTRMGVGDGENFRFLLDFPAAKEVPRALYGPVDAGLLCRSIRTPHYASLEQCLSAHDFGEDTVQEEGVHPVLDFTPAAMVQISIYNSTNLPLGVGKIMIPLDLVGLYQKNEHLYLGRLAMKLLGPQEAELDYLGAPSIAGVSDAMRDLAGEPMIPLKKSFLFVHNYRTKTGLDFGF